MPFEEEKGPGTYRGRMRYFPWEFVFLSAYLSINVNLDLRNMPKNYFYKLGVFWVNDAWCDQFSYHKRAPFFSQMRANKVYHKTFFRRILSSPEVSPTSDAKYTLSLRVRPRGSDNIRQILLENAV